MTMIMNPNTEQKGRKAKSVRQNRTRKRVAKRKRERRMVVVKKAILKKLKRKLLIRTLLLLAVRRVVDEKRLKKRKHQHQLIQVSLLIHKLMNHFALKILVQPLSPFNYVKFHISSP